MANLTGTRPYTGWLAYQPVDSLVKSVRVTASLGCGSLDVFVSKLELLFWGDIMMIKLIFF